MARDLMGSWDPGTGLQRLLTRQVLSQEATPIITLAVAPRKYSVLDPPYRQSPGGL